MKRVREPNDCCTDSQSVFVRAVELHKSGQLHEAEMLYQRALEDDPNHPDANHNLGVIALQADKPIVSLAYFKKALQINSKNQQYWLSYLSALLKFGKTNEAETIYVTAFVSGVRSESMDLFAEKLLRKSNDPAAFLNKLGIVLMEHGKCAEAESQYLKALHFKPSSDGLYNNLGNAVREQGRLCEAEIIYRTALELNPNFSVAHNNLGNVLKDQGKLGQAVLSYRRALAITPGFGQALNNLGVVFMQQRRLMLAKNIFSRALELEPDCSNVHSNLGIVYSHLGCMEQAVREFSVAADLSPNQPENYINLGDALRFTLEVRREISAYQKALEKDPDNLGLEAAVWLAVRSYLEEDFELFSGILDKTSSLSQNRNGLHKVAAVYWSYLNDLRKWRAESGELAQVAKGNQGILYVIGESHSLATHGVCVKVNEALLICKAQWIAGCKQWHLGSPDSNRYKYKFESIIKSLPPMSSILLTIGEIDCRLGEGIAKAAKKYPLRSIEEIISDTISGYISYLTKMAVNYDQTFIVSGVPALNRTQTAVQQDYVIEHSLLISKFNSILKEEVLNAGMGFLDVFVLTNRGDNFSNQKWHIDSTHLKPSAFSEAFDKNYLKSDF